MGMLGGELPAGTGRHADHQRHRELAIGHMGNAGSVVHDLSERQQAEVDCHDFNNRPHARHGRAATGADEHRFRPGGVANAFATELRQQACADRITTAIGGEVFAHHEDARVSLQCGAYRLLAGYRDRSCWSCRYLIHGDEAFKVFERLIVTGCSERDCRRDPCFGRRFEFRRFVVEHPMAALQPSLETQDGATLFPDLDFGFVAIELRVEH